MTTAVDLRFSSLTDATARLLLMETPWSAKQLEGWLCCTPSILTDSQARHTDCQCLHNNVPILDQTSNVEVRFARFPPDLSSVVSPVQGSSTVINELSVLRGISLVLELETHEYVKAVFSLSKTVSQGPYSASWVQICRGFACIVDAPY
jgi:hypothetical protein